MNDIPKIYTLNEVLEKLKGLCGRTKLLEHLREHPFFDGEPTHRRWLNKIVFREDDIHRLFASFESGHHVREKSQSQNLGNLSEEKKLQRALKLLERKVQPKSRARRPPRG